MRWKTIFKKLQDEICASLSKLDKQTFQEDKWERPEGGGGRTRIFNYGTVLEKAGVNISSVHGVLPLEVAKSFHTHVQNFAACGISLVIHPISPKVPTIHMNLRYFEMEKWRTLVWWRNRFDSLLPI